MAIDMKQIKKRKVEPSKEKKVAVSIKVSEDMSKWMRKNEISPTGLFFAALEEVGFVDKESEHFVENAKEFSKMAKKNNLKLDILK